MLHHNHGLADWVLSKEEMNKTIKSLMEKVKVVTTYDIPYVAGYSQDGKTVYVDKHLPRYFTLDGNRVDITKYIVLHEAVEKSILEWYEVPYQIAHQVALSAEKSAVELDGHDWEKYNDECLKYIDQIDVENLISVPKDLDLQPYRDEKDLKILRAIREAQK